MNAKRSAVVAFAFDSNPATPANGLIATIALEKAAQIGSREIFAQPFVPILRFAGAAAIKLEQTSEGRDNPLAIILVARQAIRWARLNQIQVLWISAAKPSMWRCRRDLMVAAREAGYVVEIKACEEAFTAEMGWFFPQADQQRVRSWSRWALRELIIWLMPFWLYDRLSKGQQKTGQIWR